MKIPSPTPTFMFTVAFYLFIVLCAAAIAHKMAGPDCCNRGPMDSSPINMTR